jgi:hypothetical protein
MENTIENKRACLIATLIKSGLSVTDAVAAAQASEAYVFGAAPQAEDTTPLPKAIANRISFAKLTAEKPPALENGVVMVKFAHGTGAIRDRSKPIKRHHWTDDDFRRVRVLVHEGVPLDVIANRIGVTHKALYNKIIEGRIPDVVYERNELRSLATSIMWLERKERQVSQTADADLPGQPYV